MAEKGTETQTRGHRKLRQGVVVSRSGDKSIVVLVERRYTHPLYGKVVKKEKRYHTHDAGNEAQVGDHVSITEMRPVSKLKRWRLTGFVSRVSDKLEQGTQ